MLLTPRYDDPDLLRFDLDLGDLAGASIRQRRRLADLMATLDAEQWATQSRCDAWTARDVIDHLITVNDFWTASIEAGRAGEPTRVMERFDPVETPKVLIDRGRSDPQVLDRFVASNDALDVALGQIDDWSVLAEAPPGHVSLTAVVAHGLWDAWTHERDIAVPLGLESPVEPEEVRPALIYCAALAPTLAVTLGAAHRGALVVDATDHDVHAVFDVDGGVRVHDGPAPEDAVRLTGDAVSLLEALSYRAPLDAEVPEDGRWLVAGLGTVFDVA